MNRGFIGQRPKCYKQADRWTEMMRRTLPATVATLLLACGSEPEPVEVERVEHAAIHTLVMGREDPSGIAPGFDVDGFDSDEHDGRACYQPDFVDTYGRRGIDNQLATIMPLIDLAGEGALEALVQGSINEGQALMVVEMAHRSDGLVDLTLHRANDTPLLGTDNKLLAGQTLALADQSVLGSFEGATLEGNLLRAGPMDLELPVIVFTILYVANIQGALLEFELDEEGNLTKGRIGGAMTVEQILALAGTASEQTHGLEDLIGGGIQGSADLGRDADAKCQALSIGVTFEARRVFTF